MTRARSWCVAVVLIVTPGMALAQQTQPANSMSFFVTSVGPGKGGNLGGLLGADRHCQMLAARDRIGNGPWYNAKGVLIASSVANLHSDGNNINKMTALTEKGDPLPGRGDTPNKHDILTGSQPDGTAYPGSDSANTTCGNWVRYFPMSGKARVGHFDKNGNDTTSVRDGIVMA